MSEKQDRNYMRRAIELAKAGQGWAHPNPLVGAVIVKDGRIIGEGYHRKCGQLHAERNAIASLTESAEGATIYVTLEPCCHYGKTPPCTEAIIQQNIRRVVIGSRDPNPLVAGKGAKILREAGIEVVEDFLRKECDALNPVFFHYITTKTPYVVMKYAMTADGKIATKTGASKWITGEEARREVQRMRHACMGIMVGIGTVLADDPLLNCRLEKEDLPEAAPLRATAAGASADGEMTGALPVTEAAVHAEDDSLGVCHPIRIICDSRLRIPLDTQICRTADQYETIVVCAVPVLPEGEIGQEKPEASPGEQAPESLLQKIRALQEKGITVLNVPQPDSEGSAPETEHGIVDLRRLMEILGARSIDSVLLEGGGTLNDSALRAGIVSEVRAFLAPKMFGGTAKSPVEGMGVDAPDQAVRMQLAGIELFGEDLMLRFVPLGDAGEIRSESEQGSGIS